MPKRPSFQFYPGDWLRDSIAACSLEAQGLWLRMMIVMHDAEPYGHFAMGGKPISVAAAARLCGCLTSDFERMMAELDSAGVPSRTPEGVIFSRRMVRDENERARWADNKRRQRGDTADSSMSPACPRLVPAMSPLSSSSSSSSIKSASAPLLSNDRWNTLTAEQQAKLEQDAERNMPIWDAVRAAGGDKQLAYAVCMGGGTVDAVARAAAKTNGKSGATLRMKLRAEGVRV